MVNEEMTTRELTKIQIYRYVAKDTILDIADMLDPDGRRSKVVFTLVQFDEQFKATQRVKHFVDADDLKLVCHDLLSGMFTAFEDHKGTVHDDYTEARVLSFKRETKYRQPYVLRIDNGQGEVFGTGQVKMVRVTESVTLQMPEFDARKMALVVRDYVAQWEMINFRKRQEARTSTFVVGQEAEAAVSEAMEPTPAAGGRRRQTA
jgi:hypothetical protein